MKNILHVLSVPTHCFNGCAPHIRPEQVASLCCPLPCLASFDLSSPGVYRYVLLSFQRPLSLLILLSEALSLEIPQEGLTGRYSLISCLLIKVFAFYT